MANEEARKLPPQNLEAEESLIGGVLIDNTALDRALELVEPDDFYREAHRKLMRAMLALHERNEPVDLVTLSDEMRRRGELQEIGGSPYLVELADKVPTA